MEILTVVLEFHLVIIVSALFFPSSIAREFLGDRQRLCGKMSYCGVKTPYARPMGQDDGKIERKNNDFIEVLRQRMPLVLGVLIAFRDSG